jgi:biopolymer transport protein TolQ
LTLALARTPELGRLVAEAGPVAHLTLGLLAVLSVGVWAVWGSRWLALRRLVRSTVEARREHRAAGGAEAFEARSRDLAPGPLTRLLAAARDEQRRLARGDGSWTPTSSSAARSVLERTLATRREEELQRARRGLTSLATVGATAPFIGLFGTVWGIMDAFLAIGEARSADLAVVAPGIAEALTTTGLGLVAAIPAVWAYNSLTRQVRRLGLELDGFATELVNEHDRSVAAAES